MIKNQTGHLCRTLGVFLEHYTYTVAQRCLARMKSVKETTYRRKMTTPLVQFFSIYCVGSDPSPTRP